MKEVHCFHGIMRDTHSLSDLAPLSLGCGTYPKDPQWLLEHHPSNTLQKGSKRMDTKKSIHTLKHFCTHQAKLIYIAADSGQGGTEKTLFLSGMQCAYLEEVGLLLLIGRGV